MDLSRIITFEDDQDTSTGYVSVAGKTTPGLKQILNEVKDRYNRCPIAKTWPMTSVVAETDWYGLYVRFIFGTDPTWGLAPNISLGCGAATEEDWLEKFGKDLRGRKQQIINVEWVGQLSKKNQIPTKKNPYLKRWWEVNQLDVVGVLTNVWETFYIVFNDVVKKYYPDMMLNESYNTDLITFDADDDISTGFVDVNTNEIKSLTPELFASLIEKGYNISEIGRHYPIKVWYTEHGKSIGMAVSYEGTELNYDIPFPVSIKNPVPEFDNNTLMVIKERFSDMSEYSTIWTRWYDDVKYAKKNINNLSSVGKKIFEVLRGTVFDILKKYVPESRDILNESQNLITFDDDLNASTGHISLSQTEYPKPEFKTNIDVVDFLKNEYGARYIDLMFDGGVDGMYDIVISPYGRLQQLKDFRGDLWCGWDYEGDLSIDPQPWVDMFKGWAREIRSGEDFDLCDRMNTDDTWNGNDKKHDEFMEYVRNATQEIVMVMDGHYPQANGLNESADVHNLITFDEDDEDTSTGFVNVSQPQPETRWKVFKDFRSWFFFIARLLEKKCIITGYDDETGYEEGYDGEDEEYTRYRLQFNNGRHFFGPRYSFFSVTVYGTEDREDPDYAYYCFKQELDEEIEAIENGDYMDMEPSVLEGLKYIRDVMVRNTRYHDTQADGSHLFMRIPTELEELLNEGVQTKLLAFDDGTDTSTGFVGVSDNIANKVSYVDLFGTELMFEGYMEKFFDDEYGRNIEVTCQSHRAYSEFIVRVEPENISVEFNLSVDFGILSDDEKIADIMDAIKEKLEYPDVTYGWYYETEQDPDDSRDEDTYEVELMAECKYIKRAFEEFVKTVENGLKTGHLKHLDESLNLMSFDDEEDTSTGFISTGGYRRAVEPISGIRFLKWMYENGGYYNSDGFNGSWTSAETEEDLNTLDIDCYAEEYFGGGDYEYPEDATLADFIDMFEGKTDCWFEYFYKCWGGPVLGQTFIEGDMKCKVYNDYESFVKWLDDIENIDVEKYIRDYFGREMDDYAFMMREKEYGEEVDYFSKFGPEGVSHIMNGYRDDFMKGALEPITKGFQGLVEKGRKLLKDYRIYCSTLDIDR